MPVSFERRFIESFANTRLLLHVTEPITIKGVGQVTAKIDSGNEAYNVLTGVDITIDGDNCSFITVDNKRCTLPLEGQININIGSGNIESRPTVKLDLTLKNKTYTGVVFSIADRSTNTEPVLIGAPFIKEIGALIDCTQM